MRSINSAPGNASPSTFGSTLLHIPAGITPQGRPLCAHVFSLSFLHFDGLHSRHLVRPWLQVRTPMQTLRFELSPLHFCSPPLTQTPPTTEQLWSRTPRVKRATMNSPQARPCGGFPSRGLYIFFRELEDRLPTAMELPGIRCHGGGFQTGYHTLNS